MQPLNILNNVQKARLLHELFVQEIPYFLGYLHELTESILNDKESIVERWDSPMLGAGFWFDLADTVRSVLIEYRKDLPKSRHVFSEKLFGGYAAIYTVHGLMQYKVKSEKANPKFKLAIDLLFA